MFIKRHLRLCWKWKKKVFVLICMKRIICIKIYIHVPKPYIDLIQGFEQHFCFNCYDKSNNTYNYLLNSIFLVFSLSAFFLFFSFLSTIYFSSVNYELNCNVLSNIFHLWRKWLNMGHKQGLHYYTNKNNVFMPIVWFNILMAQLMKII